MKMPINKIKSLLNRKYALYFLTVLLFWIKTYIVYRAEFNLGLQNGMQHFLLVINPISSALFFFALALFFKGRARLIAITAIDLLLSILLYANVCYYRFFNDFITLPVLFQTKNFGDIGGSAVALMRPYDIFYFFDTIMIAALIISKVVKIDREKINRRSIAGLLIAAVAFFVFNLGLAEADRPQLLTRTFDRNYIVKYLGMYNYTIYDAIQTTKSSAQRAMADSSDVSDVENYVKANYTEPNSKYFGAAKGMNVIYISLESFQNFLINYKLDGKEVTPFLNSLTKDKNTIYFDNFFHQTGQGKTSDAEFMMENSLFPLPTGSVFTTKAQNTYQAAPAILGERGYTTAVFHGNYKTFWNRDEMYKSFGYDRFFDAKYYDMSDENTINYGMKDKPWFKESMPYLTSLPKPFYAKFITLSNHFPFILDDKDIDFPKGNFGDKTVDNYFQTAHYLDEALRQFFTYLKQSGLYDHTVIIMYGDHYGISENHNAAMAKVLGVPEITPYINAQLQRVPLFIHIPGVKGGVNHTYGGEIDVMPTVMHLLGVDTKDYIQFGSDLLSNNHRQVVAFRNGDFVTNKYTQVSGTLYNTATGEKVNAKLGKKDEQIVKEELNLSDKVVYDDLLRFYKPKGFTAVNRNDFDYTKDQKDMSGLPRTKADATKKSNSK
ncbi:LTA synthase family protein [Weizmannia acidilactici]|uniref:LTA synthase family protein n=1 Tax=Weizmannia acidilactici TaxID=2607726 RepID=UPI00124F0F0E|nr:LTA synthase family protein [Weizmannia acidilactici]GER74537.1 phosphoglycerol transferase [Weizmannia acidilactici]